MDHASMQDQRPRRRTGTCRERTGCLTCRRRKKKCDLIYPICGHCRRLNLECAYEEPRGEETNRQCPSPRPLLVTSRWPVSGSVVWSSLSLTAYPPCQAGEGDSLPLVRRRMLRYYTESFAMLLTATLQNNGFLSVLLPMSIESNALQDSIVAWAASHLALRQPSFKELALRRRSVSLKSLSESIASPNYSPDLVLANTLVLCSMETILGTQQWFHHLQGGCQVIRAAITSQSLRKNFDSIEGRWLLRNYAYHDAMMSITVDRRPLLPYELYCFAGDSITLDSYVGFAFTPITLVMEISHLRADMLQQAHQETAPTDEDQGTAPATAGYPSIPFSQRAFALEKQLKDWTYSRTDDAPLACLAEAYRSATLIHLYRSIRQHLPEYSAAISQKIESQVARICEQIALMPLACLPECTLPFPLFLAGSEAETEEHIGLIRHRMMHVVENRAFENVRSALAVLEELWRTRAKGSSAEGQRKVDFLDVLQRRQWKLALT